MAEHDIEKLPRWAQRQIQKLEADLIYWKKKATVGPEDSNTFAHPYDSVPTPLGKSPLIAYVVGDDFRERITVENRADMIYVSANDSLAIEPVASNCFYVRRVRR